METEPAVQLVVPRRGWRDPAALIAVVLAAAVGLLVWRPWGGGADLYGPDGAAAPLGPSVGLSPGPGRGGGPMGVVDVGDATPTPSSSPSLTPSPAPTRIPLSLLHGPPSATLFDQEWSVVAVYDPVYPLSAAGHWVTQQPITVAERPLDVRSGPPRWICPLPGEFRRPLAAHAPAGRVRLIGVAFPASAGAWSVGVSVEEGRPLAIREIYLRNIPPHMTPPLTPWVRVFALADGSTWPRGIYRFAVSFPDGSHRYLYACVGV